MLKSGLFIIMDMDRSLCKTLLEFRIRGAVNRTALSWRYDMIHKSSTHRDIELPATRAPGRFKEHSAEGAESAVQIDTEALKEKADLSDSVTLASATKDTGAENKVIYGNPRQAEVSSGSLSLSDSVNGSSITDGSGFDTGNGITIDPFEPNNNIRKTVYTPPPGEKEWTVLVYMAGDNDLEPYLVNNLIALEKVGSNDGVNVVVELDRGEKPRSPVTKWKGSRRLLIQKSDDNARVASPVVQELGPVNMADPGHLSDFIQWGMKNYPARHYMVIINDHGYGFMGAADDKGNKDTMNLKEMHQGFDSALKGIQNTVTEGVKDAAQATGRKIDVIGFDACLMSMVEVGYELKDHADLMVASQEVIGSGGWPYGAFAEGASKLDKGPGAPYNMPPRDIMAEISKYAFPSNLAMSTFLEKAQKIIDKKGELSPETFAHGIITQCEKHIDTTPTMAAFRLGDHIARLADSLKELGVAMKDSEYKDELLEIIRQTQHYNMNAPEQNPYGDFRDISDFCQKIIDSPDISDKKLKSVSKAVKKALDEAVVDRTESKLLPEKYKDSHGISVYLPDSSGGTDFGYKETSFDKATGWLDNVRQVAVNDPEEKWEPLYKPPKLANNRKKETGTA